MRERRPDSLLVRYLGQLLRGSLPSLEHLADRDPELLASLRQRVDLFERLDQALGRTLPPLEGQTLGHYLFLERLGAGGMGEVYRGEDLRLGREVALKVLPPVFALDRQRTARFEREARLLAALDHPGISSIYGLERSSIDIRDAAPVELTFLVLELVPGETLEHRLERGALPIQDVLELGLQLTRALEAAHTRGIVHRDLKPANLKITPDGALKVLDFGLGKTSGIEGWRELAQAGSLVSLGPQARYATLTGTILGTAAYMSPEQARGEETDRRTDIWSFGCVLYEALSGSKTFAGDSFSDTVVAVLEREPDWSRLPEATPEPIERGLRRCLAKERDHRLHDIADARLELEEILAPSRPRRPQRARSPARSLGGGLAAALLLALAGFTYLWLRNGEPAAGGDRESVGGVLAVPFSSPEEHLAHLRRVNAEWRSERARRLAASPVPGDGLYVATQDPDRLVLLDALTGEVSRTFPLALEAGEQAVGVALAPGGQRAYLAISGGRRVVAIDLEHGGSTAVRLPGEPSALELSPDGGRAFVGLDTGGVAVLDTDPGSTTFGTLVPFAGGALIALDGTPSALALAPDGKRLYAALGDRDRVAVLDVDWTSPALRTLVPVPTAIEVASRPLDLALSPDGRFAWVVCALANAVAVLDLQPESPTFHTVVRNLVTHDGWGGEEYPVAVSLTPDGTRAYIALESAREILVLDAVFHTLVVPPIRVFDPSGITIASDGSRAWVTSRYTRELWILDTDPSSPSFNTRIDLVPVIGRPSATAIGPRPG